MKIQDICELKTILGIVEGATIEMPEPAATMLETWLEIAHGILNREVEAVCGK